MTADLSDFIRSLYQTSDPIPLHSPTFGERERRYVIETIDSTFVSSVGKFVDQFESDIQTFTGCTRAIATVNGSTALHTALYLSGVDQGDFVITQPLTFVATCNVIHQLGAEPLFIDVARDTLGLCPIALESYLEAEAVIDGEQCKHRSTGRTIRAVVPMHTFGHPVDLDEIVRVCNAWRLTLVEDAAESLGSLYKQRHTGTFGKYAALSFNGNKIITTGGGGMLLCASQQDGKRAKHVTTTAKVAHPYEFYHDEPGFNYRMPNLNAALGCAQMNQLPRFLAQKRQLANQYRDYFASTDYVFIDEPVHGESNFWLNAILCETTAQRDEFLVSQNEAGIMCRPVWQLMHLLPMFAKCERGSLNTAEDVAGRLVNLPSSPIEIG